MLVIGVFVYGDCTGGDCWGSGGGVGCEDGSYDCYRSAILKCMFGGGDGRGVVVCCDGGGGSGNGWVVLGVVLQ